MLLLRRNAYLWLRRCGEGARQEVSQPCILTPAMGQARVSSFILSCLCFRKFRMSTKISIFQINSRSHKSSKFHYVHFVFSSKIPWFATLFTRSSCLTGGWHRQPSQPPSLTFDLPEGLIIRSRSTTNGNIRCNTVFIRFLKHQSQALNAKLVRSHLSRPLTLTLISLLVLRHSVWEQILTSWIKASTPTVALLTSKKRQMSILP